MRTSFQKTWSQHSSLKTLPERFGFQRWAVAKSLETCLYSHLFRYDLDFYYAECFFRVQSAIVRISSGWQLLHYVFTTQNAAKAIKNEPSNSKPPAEEPPSAPSEPEEPMSPAHISTPPTDKPARKKATKPPKMPKAPKPPKEPKIKEGGKKKAKKAKESILPEKKPSCLAALESHAKDILNKMDQPKK